MRKLLLWVSLVGGAWAQPLHLVFEVQETVTPEKGKPKVSKFPIEVGLGTRHLSRSFQGEKVWMDFDKLRVLEATGKQVEENSLYAQVGFRWAEANNRWHLGEGLNQAGIKEAAAMFDPVLTEHRFSILNPEAKNRPKIEGLRATYQGKVLLEGQGKGTALSEQQAAAYVRFLRYQFGGHPLALKELEKARRIPQSLRLLFPDQPRRVSFLVTLKTCQPGAEPAPPRGLKLASGSGLTGHARKAAQLSDQKEHSRAVLQKAEAAIQDGQVLTAVLLYLGDSLATGDQSGTGLREHREKFQADPNCKVLFANLSGQDEAASQKLKGLEKAAGPALHVLRIFQAGVLSARNENRQAMKLYQEALQGDPHIAGAWKDLGDMYFQAYECEPAWQCWDAARHLAPDFKPLQKVNELEQMLRKEYPEFF